MRSEARTNRQAILRALEAAPRGKTIDQIAWETGLHYVTTSIHLRALKRSGHVTATRAAPNGRRGRGPLVYQARHRAALLRAVQRHPALGEALVEAPTLPRPQSARTA